MRAGLCALLVLIAACVERQPFHCEQDAECGDGGRCEAIGVCSFVDASCESTRRFDASAGDLASTCVVEPCGNEPGGPGGPGDATAIVDPETHRCFWRQAANASWRAAGNQCERSGGTLVTLEDVRLDQLVAPLFESTAWIGLGRPAGELLWVDGSPVGGFQPFLSGEPSTGDDCVARRSEGGWEGRACSEALPSVCQRDR